MTFFFSSNISKTLVFFFWHSFEKQFSFFFWPVQSQTLVGQQVITTLCSLYIVSFCVKGAIVKLLLQADKNWTRNSKKKKKKENQHDLHLSTNQCISYCRASVECVRTLSDWKREGRKVVTVKNCSFFHCNATSTLLLYPSVSVHAKITMMSYTVGWVVGLRARGLIWTVLARPSQVAPGYAEKRAAPAYRWCENRQD